MEEQTKELFDSEERLRQVPVRGHKRCGLGLEPGYKRALVDEYGVPFRMAGSMADLTGLRKVQDDLQESNSNLRKINTDPDNFIYTASHNLKAPVTCLEGLMKLLGPQLSSKARQERAAGGEHDKAIGG